ncbi:MAG: pilus assembly protein PilM [Nitrospirales bacterium]
METLIKYRWNRMIAHASGLFRPVPPAIGVDVGSRLLKTVVVQKNNHRLSLIDFSIQAMGESSSHDELFYAELVETLKEKLTVPLPTIGTSLSGPSVLIKPLILPMMTEEELREHLTLELDRYITLDVQDVFWDVCYQSIRQKGTEDQQEHFLVVAKKECVSHQVEAFRRYGVTLQFVDIDVFALINLVTYNYGNEGSWLLANVGPTGIVMAVIAKGHPRHIRKVAYEAEWYGDLLDQLLLPQRSSKTRNEPGTSELLLLEQFFEEIRQHIVETLEGLSESSTVVIDRGVLLSGGYALVPDVVSTLAQSLGMPVRPLDPFQSITVPQAIQEDPTFQQAAPLMSVAVGVALRGALVHD